MPQPVISDRDPKPCSTCGVEKPLTEYYEKRVRGRDKTKRQWESRCKACCVERVRQRMNGPQRGKILEYRQRHYQRLKAEGRANLGWEGRHYGRTFNSSKAAYDVQLIDQNGRCAVCLRLPAEGEIRFSFDHDHTTGLARGVLCHACNGGLGCFRDDEELMKAAITYLREWAIRHVAETVNE
jgi:hypothetical protein